MDNKLKVLNYLGKNFKNSYTMHELSKTLKIPYASFYRTIQDMKDLIVINSVGKSKIMQLNIKNTVIKSHLVVSSDEERKDFLDKQPIIKKIYNELNTKSIVLIFGSYAKGKENEKSDIDILMINKEGNKDINFSKYELLFKKKINPVFITKKEFKKMLEAEEENIGKQALKNHIILNNPEEFWECILNAV